MADRATQERIARNEAIFREANEQIEKAAEANGLARPVPFICECGDPRCVTLLQLDLDVYRRVRSDDRHFVVVPGHESDIEETTVVEQHPDYVIVGKQDRAGELAAELADG